MGGHYILAFGPAETVGPLGVILGIDLLLLRLHFWISFVPVGKRDAVCFGAAAADSVQHPQKNQKLYLSIWNGHVLHQYPFSSL